MEGLIRQGQRLPLAIHLDSFLRGGDARISSPFLEKSSYQ